MGRAQRPVSLRELTDELGIDRSSVFRLANTLKRRGFLAQAPGGKDYVLGFAIRRLAERVSWDNVLVQVAREHVAKLAGDTGETAHLAIRNGREALCIDHQLTDRPVGVSVRTGRAEPLHCTALGKALLLDCQLDQLTAIYGAEPLPEATSRAVSSLEGLAEECRRARRNGYGVDDEECHARVRCVAAPIRDGAGEIIAAIGVSAPADRLPKSQFKAVAKRVAAAAQAISAKVGGSTGNS